MNKTRLLVISVVTLIALNIALVAVFMFNKPPHPPHKFGNEGPKDIIIKKLHFDAQQIAAYENLIKAHRANIEEKDAQLKIAKEELYLTLSVDKQLEKTVLIDRINSIQKEIEEIHFNHFLDIKKLCKENQLNDYNELTHELARLFSPHQKPKR